MWDLESGTLVREWDMKVPYQLDKQFVRSLSFTNDGKQLVTGNGDSTLYQLKVPEEADKAGKKEDEKPADKVEKKDPS